MVKNFKIFIGFDSREKIAYHVLSQSIIANSSIPVSITPINLKNLRHFYNRPKTKKHSTEFSISRFLTPYLSNYKGYSLYLDCDFIILKDIAKLLNIKYWTTIVIYQNNKEIYRSIGSSKNCYSTQSKKYRCTL